MGKKRIIFQIDGNARFELGWYHRTPNAINGSMWGLLHNYLGAIGVIDFHFSYPRNGEYHYTARLADGVIYHVWHDHAAKQDPILKSWNRLSRDALPQLIEHLVPHYQPEPFSSFLQPILFQVATMAFIQSPAWQNGMAKQPQGRFDSDIVFTKSDLASGNNFTIMLLGKNSPTASKFREDAVDKTAIPWVAAGLI